MYFQYLSIEILTKIFEYCDIRELYNLQQTCKHFYHIIKEATTLGNIPPLLVTNQLGQNIRKRSLKLLTLQEKFFYLKNWKRGLYKEYCLLKERKKYMPKIVLTNDNLWISKGNKILRHKRNLIGISLLEADYYHIPIPTKSDVSSFVLKDNTIATGHHDGSIYVKKVSEEFICIKEAHESDVHSIDLLDGNFISGSKNGCLKIWNFKTLNPNYSCQVVNDRIWSVAFSKGCKYIGVGTAKTNNCSPLFIYDTNSCKLLNELGELLPKGTGLLQLKWETPHIILSCGYDGNVHKWDLRCNICVQAWRDPFVTPVYCFDTDDYCTLVTGVAMHGRTVLWDVRMTSYIQMYFMNSCKKTTHSSPVYSLSFDVDHLFAATDYHLNILNFSVRTGTAKNYDNSVLPFLV